MERDIERLRAASHVAARQAKYGWLRDTDPAFDHEDLQQEVQERLLMRPAPSHVDLRAAAHMAARSVVHRHYGNRERNAVRHPAERIDGLDRIVSPDGERTARTRAVTDPQDPYDDLAAADPLLAFIERANANAPGDGRTLQWRVLADHLGITPPELASLTDRSRTAEQSAASRARMRVVCLAAQTIAEQDLLRLARSIRLSAAQVGCLMRLHRLPAVRTECGVGEGCECGALAGTLGLSLCSFVLANSLQSGVC